MLSTICQYRIDLSRKTSLLLESTTVVASITLTRAPTRKTNLHFNFSSAVSGTITIVGELDSATVNETLTVTSSDFKYSKKTYDTITSISLSAAIVSAGVDITIKSVNKDGSENTQETAITTNYRAQLKRSAGKAFSVGDEGSYQSNDPYVMIPYTTSFTPRDTDVITVVSTGEKFYVVSNPLIEHVGMMRHWQCKLKRYQR